MERPEAEPRTNDLEVGVAAATRSPVVLVLVVVGGGGLPGASAHGGSVNRHSVVRGSVPQFVQAQEVAPHCVRAPSTGDAQT